MADYGSQDVKCPFYISESEKQLNCEGIAVKTCAQLFKNAKKKKHYKMLYCNSDYKSCRHFETVEKLYK